METYYYVLGAVLVLCGILYAANPVIKFRSKHVAVLPILSFIGMVYFLVKGIRTGNKYDFAVVGIFIAAVLIEYFKRKNNKQEKET